jgi:hypothetical protein
LAAFFLTRMIWQRRLALIMAHTDTLISTTLRTTNFQSPDRMTAASAYERHLTLTGKSQLRGGVGRVIPTAKRLIRLCAVNAGFGLSSYRGVNTP